MTNHFSALISLRQVQRTSRSLLRRSALASIAGLLVSFTSPAFAQAPVANDDNAGTGLAAITEGGSITGTYNVLTNDTNAPTVANPVSFPANSSAFVLNADGTFNYTHDGSETSSDSFTYTANNGEESNVATVTITINNTNDTPSLSLNGPGTVNLGTGDTYNEQGASATDEEDNNATLTAAIVVGGDCRQYVRAGRVHRNLQRHRFRWRTGNPGDPHRQCRRR